MHVVPQWGGEVAVMTRPPHVVKNDDGSGSGYGRGWGSGSGSGCGSGSGYGRGYGSSRGSDLGYGSGETGRWLDTSHPHYTAEWCKLQGGATPYKALQ